ncbi:MAG TPA: SAM-dependent methyltransferase [Bacteroidia bacterium]|nr:SAM-dependent methyltransferase [Bacteroidia bacterium]
MPSGTLYLFPVTLGETEVSLVIPAFNIELIKTITVFIAEDAKNARRFLKQCGYPDLSKAEILLLNEHTKGAELPSLINALFQGKDIRLLSDAGCPGIADPGADVVKHAHQKNIKVVALAGPSSIVLSIMASGFNGQNFAFNGYLPIEKPARIKRMKELEQLVYKNDQSQFFIETPYRNIPLFDDLLDNLSSETLLCLGINLTTSTQKIITKSISDWKKTVKPDLNKIPVVFGIYKN